MIHRYQNFAEIWCCHLQCGNATLKTDYAVSPKKIGIFPSTWNHISGTLRSQWPNLPWHLTKRVSVLKIVVGKKKQFGRFVKLDSAREENELQEVQKEINALQIFAINQTMKMNGGVMCVKDSNLLGSDPVFPTFWRITAPSSWSIKQ